MTPDAPSVFTTWWRRAGPLSGYIRKHEGLVFAALKQGTELRKLRAYHERRLTYLQAERFVHLFVTLAFGVFFLAAFVGYLIQPSLLFVALLALMLILLVPYIFHYFLLENAVQRWYDVSEEIDRRLGKIPGVAAQDAPPSS
jgi:hypothetical protein